MTAETKSLLVIGAHFDDCECGSAAGVSSKLAKAGWRVVFLNTIGDHTTFAGTPTLEEQRRLLGEAHLAAKVLGAEKRFLNYRHNAFHPDSWEAVAGIAKVVQEINPELAIIQWADDAHYDHARTARASLEALSYPNRFGGGKPVAIKLKEILAYETSSWQTRNFSPDFYVDISDEMTSVEDSIRTFKTIGSAAERYVKEKRYRAQHWGLAAGCAFAEGLKHLGPRFPIASELPTIFGTALIPVGSNQYPWGGQHF